MRKHARLLWWSLQGERKATFLYYWSISCNFRAKTKHKCHSILSPWPTCMYEHILFSVPTCMCIIGTGEKGLKFKSKTNVYILLHTVSLHLQSVHYLFIYLKWSKKYVGEICLNMYGAPKGVWAKTFFSPWVSNVYQIHIVYAALVVWFPATYLINKTLRIFKDYAHSKSLQYFRYFF